MYVRPVLREVTNICRKLRLRLHMCSAAPLKRTRVLVYVSQKKQLHPAMFWARSDILIFGFVRLCSPLRSELYKFFFRDFLWTCCSFHTHASLRPKYRRPRSYGVVSCLFLSIWLITTCLSPSWLAKCFFYRYPKNARLLHVALLRPPREILDSICRN